MLKKKQKILIGISIGMGILVLLGILWINLYRINPVCTSFEVELGEELSTSLSDYVKGYDWSVKGAKLSTEEVNTDAVGEYVATIEHGWQHFTYEIHVVDTVAPEFTPKEGQIYLAKGESYFVTEFYEEVYDYSNQVKIVAKDFENNKVVFDSTGVNTVNLIASDPSGNTTSLRVSVIVDTPPEILNIPDYYVKKGDIFDLLDGVIAFDSVDGDVSASLNVDYDRFDIDQAGTQYVYFTATDSYGLEARKRVEIGVYEEEDICEMIGRREISVKDSVVSKVTNYYDGGASKMESVEDQMLYMLPCVIHIDTDYHTDSVLYVHGSGFIIDMDEEYVYIMSNDHVMKYTEEGTAYFYDGEKAKYQVLYTNPGEDVAVGAILKSDIPEGTLKNLFSIHSSMTAYEDILSNHKTRLFIEITTDKGLDYTRLGVSVEENDDFYVVNESCLQVTVSMKAGNSGSAVIDEYGNLIGMCVGLRFDSGVGYRYYCIPLKTLMENYEEATGNKLYCEGQ